MMGGQSWEEKLQITEAQVEEQRLNGQHPNTEGREEQR